MHIIVVNLQYSTLSIHDAHYRFVLQTFKVKLAPWHVSVHFLAAVSFMHDCTVMCCCVEHAHTIR